MQPVQIALQLIDGLMQSAFDQSVDADVAPLGQQLTAQAFQVIRWAGVGFPLNALQRLVDLLQAEANRTGKDRIQEQELCCGRVPV